MMTFRNDYKIAFFDIDGTTVITSEGLVRQSAAEALRRLREAGVKLCIATGRPPVHTRIVSEAMGGADYKVSCNGCIVVDRQGNIVYGAPLKPAVFEDIRKYASETGSGLAFHFNEQTYIYDNGERVVKHYSMVKEGAEVYRFCPTQDRHLQEGEGQYPYNALVIVDDPEALMRYVETLGDMRYDQPWPGQFDVFCGGQSKASGIEEVLKAEGLTWEDAICFGDGSNDVEMLSKAGFGVCMGNGSDGAKAVADYITDRIENDGLAKAINKIFGFEG